MLLEEIEADDVVDCVAEALELPELELPDVEEAVIVEIEVPDTVIVVDSLEESVGLADIVAKAE